MVVAGWWVGMVVCSGGRRSWEWGGMVAVANCIVGSFSILLVIPSRVRCGGWWSPLILGGCQVCQGLQFDLLDGPVVHCKIGSGVLNRPK